MLRNGKFFVTYVDFSKAFDTVQHPILWNILLRPGVKGRMIKILNNMRSTVKACVRGGSSCTEYFDCLQGLKQGRLLSPTLFSLFINELAHDMTSNKGTVFSFPQTTWTFYYAVCGMTNPYVSHHCRSSKSDERVVSLYA